jgi:gamma-glutamyltranspeptidase/glutathione hydrolase
LSISVPGGVLGWHALHERYGSLPWDELLAPAVELARDGCKVTPFLHVVTAAARSRLDVRAQATYLDADGRALAIAARLVQPELADALDEIARLGPATLYGGDLGRRYCEGLQAVGGLIVLEDLARHEIEWTDPVRASYQGFEVLTTPPNSHGLTLLVMLNLLEARDFASLGRDTAARLHLQVEAKKLAFALREQYIGEPNDLSVDPHELASKAYARTLAPLLDAATATGVVAALPHPDSSLRCDDESDTTCFSVVDAAGNSVSFINSLFDMFGSGVVAGDTGIVCQNRASSFSLDSDHVNALGAGRRPMHTLMPVLVRRDGKPRYTIGIIGGDQQPQALLQVLQRLIDDGDSLEAAVEAPRMRSYERGRLALEPGFASLQADLEARGHEIVPADFFGSCQVIESRPDGSLRAFSDPRTGGEPRGR